MSNYTSKSDLKDTIPKFAIKADLATLNHDVDKSHINKLKNALRASNNFKVEKLNINKLETVPVDLRN